MEFKLIGMSKEKRSGLRLASAAAALSLALAVAAGSAAHAQAAASAQTPEASVTLVGNHPDEAADFASGPEISATKTLRMEAVLALRDRAGLDKLLAAQQDSSSPQYHQWLTPDEFNARFGPSQSDVSAVSAWLESKGFTLESSSATKRSLVFSGSAAHAESAFGVKIHTDDTGALYTNLSDPVLPKSVAPTIAAIAGLSNLARPYPNLKFVPNAQASPDATVGGQTAFGPNDLYTFYDQTPPTSSSNDGTGTDCIAVIEDSNFPDGDVNLFDTQFAIEPINLTHQIVTIDPGTGNANSEIEALLDVEYAHAAAPGVPIYAYIGNEATSISGSGLLDAVISAVQDNKCGVISLSFSFCGVPNSFYSGQVDQVASEANAQGQALVTAEGDDGAAGIALNKKLQACVPAHSRNINEVSADPHVTAIGGTQFTPTLDSSGNAVGYSTESVWKDKNGASGGGNSKVFAKPTFQQGIRHLTRKRAVPDVSFAASPTNPGFFLGFTDPQGNPAIGCCIGGTSMGAPYWAGIMQLAAQKKSLKRVGNLNTTLYSIQSAGGTGTHDITIGNNAFHGVGGFKAIKGYDRATGIGTPDIEALLSAIAGN